MKNLVLLIVLSACVNINYRENQHKLLLNLKNYNYSLAEKIVEDENFYKKKKDNFLNKVEKGTVYYLKNNYYQALKYFEEAQKICDESTIELSGKLKGILDSNLDFYYCEKYERSLLNFYLSLINYNLYLTGKYESYSNKIDEKIIVVPEKILNYKEKMEHLGASRNYIIKWNSLLDSFTKEYNGKSTYKDDLVAKVWGAFIHEKFNNFENNQIALQLYKDAKNVLLKNYNIYSVFNKKSELFEKNYNNFYKMNIDKIKDNYIESTQFSNDLLIFLDKKIKNLSKNKKDNFFIILKDDFIAEKKIKTFRIDIPLEFLNIKLIIENDDTNTLDLLSFALLALRKSKNNLPLIEFELPYIEEKNIKNNFIAEVFNINKEKIAEFPIVILNPNSNIARNEFNNKIKLLYSTIATKSITKHSTALISAYQIYRQNPNFTTLTTALISYKTAAKIINNTDKADLRYWVSLADNIRFGSTNLNDGEYLIDIYSIKDGIKNKIKKSLKFYNILNQ